MTVALICARCGAPLPIDATGGHFATCAYCEATLAIAGTQVSVKGNAPSTPRADAPTVSQAFTREIAEGVTSGLDPYEVIRNAAARHLGVAGQSDAVARITLAIARDFGAANKLSIERDGMALTRIAEGYLKAVAELRNAATTELNLPYLTADASGPKHLRRALDPAIIARLAGVAASETPKKKGWWPF